MDLEVSDGWVVNVLKSCLCKIGEERVDGLPPKIDGKIDAGKMEEELVRNELVGSTERGKSERRIRAPLVWLKRCRLEVAAGNVCNSCFSFEDRC